MPISVVDHFSLDRNLFEAANAFEVMLDWDTLLFVDPFLLQNAITPEFLKAHDELLEYFRKVLKLIVSSDGNNDKAWREAIKRLTFKEIGVFGLGYARGHSAGSGIGKQSATLLVRSIKEIVSLGIKDEELFELVGLFESGFGADRISDMTCNILLNRFARFTQRVFDQCGYTGNRSKFVINSIEYSLPKHPMNLRHPILLCPKELLRDLPIAEDGIDVCDVYSRNESIRDRLNAILGASWRQQIRESTKPEFRDLLIKNPDFLRELLLAYKLCPVSRYNFTDDRSGEVVWRDTSKLITDKFPLSFGSVKEKNLDYYCNIVDVICNTFKKHIEQNGLWEVLVDIDGRPRKERIAQRVFYSIAEIYCKINDLDISPESNAGRGPVDFKFSHGAKNKILVEIKLSSNGKLLDGYSKQTEAYRISESAARAYYLVVDHGGYDKKIEDLFKLKNDLAAEGKVLSEICVVDATFKKSASKLSRSDKG